MRITKNKRGAPVPMVIVVLVAFVTLTALWSILLGKLLTNKELGSKQFMLFETYQKGEQTMFFVEQSGKYAAYQSIYELAKNGSYEQEPDCGVYNGYVLWNNEGKECFPTIESINETFESVFNQRVGEYLAILLPENAEDTSNNYELELIQNDKLLIKAFPEKKINFIMSIYTTHDATYGKDLLIEFGEQIIHRESGGDGGRGPGWRSPIPEGVLSLPLANNYITSCFEERSVGSKYHHGIDLRAPIGTDVFAFADGKVIYSNWDGDYGNLIIIEHELEGYDFKFWSVYGHLSELHKIKGHVVEKGEIIGKSGNTGYSTGPHLHFEIRVGQNVYDNAVNPVVFEPNLFGKLESYNNNKPCLATPCDWQNGNVCNQYLK